MSSSISGIAKFVAVSVFIVLLGWAVVFIAIVPFIRLSQLWDMISSGKPVLLGPDLSLLPVCAIAMYYLFRGRVMSGVMRRNLWFRPFLVWAFVSLILLTLVAHICFEISIHGGSPEIMAFAGIILWRVAIVALFNKYPLYRFALSNGV